jgi:hypothetical protein
LSRSSKLCIVGSLLPRLGLSRGDDPLNAIALGVDHHQNNRPYSAKDDKAIFVIVSVIFCFLSIWIVEYTTSILKPYALVLALDLEIFFGIPVAP